MGEESGRVEERPLDPCAWDAVKSDPADGDLFDVIGLEDADERLTLARIAADPILRDDGQPAPRAVESGTVDDVVTPSPEPKHARRNSRGTS